MRLIQIILYPLGIILKLLGKVSEWAVRCICYVLGPVLLMGVGLLIYCIITVNKGGILVLAFLILATFAVLFLAVFCISNLYILSEKIIKR